MSVAVILVGGGSSVRRCSREEESADASFSPEVVVDAADDVVDEDSALQAEVGAHPRTVQLHEGHVEDRLALQGVGRLRHAADRQRTHVFLQTVLILIQFPLHPVTQHKSVETEGGQRQTTGNLHSINVLSLKSKINFIDPTQAN